MRGFPLLGAMLTLSLLAGIWFTVNDVAAQEPEPVFFNAIYFPWVPNDSEIDNTGPWYGSITVQNVDVERENLGVRFWMFDGVTINRIALNNNGEGESYTLGDALDDPSVPRFDLDPNASVTLGPGILGLPEPGSPVVVYAVYKDALDPDAEFGPRAPMIAGVQKQASPVPLNGGATTSAHVSVDGYSAIPLPDIAWGSQSDFCYVLRDGIDSCDGTGLHSVKHAPEGGFDGHSYLPIVQTNSGWNTEIYLSNVDFTAVSAAQVSITLTENQTQSASGVPQAVETVNIPPGGTAILNARDLVGEEWVGSARITSTVGISGVAMRSKPSANMLMVNTSVPSLLQASGESIPVGLFTESSAHASYHLYAPLVFRDYNGWNTGFSFVNIAERPNRVSVSYITPEGRVAVVDTRTIPARGQEFIYIPASQDLGSVPAAGEGFAGVAHFQAEHPFHVAVDQVKYSTGEAMSYLAAGSGAGAGDALMLPLVQKGWLDGSGDTSGFQVFNPSTTASVFSELRFYDSAGTLISPTRLAPMPVNLGPRETSTVYTLNLSGMAQNQRASAVLTPVDGEGWVVGISNNVNYSVAGDGSAAFQLVNLRGQYRLPVEGAGDE